MKAMIFQQAGSPLALLDRPQPQPGPEQVLIKTLACAVCRTDLHILDGDLRRPKKQLIPGHEIVGLVESVGSEVQEWKPGDRVGVPWLGWTCGECSYCQSGRENLCPRAQFTGYNLDGGYAEHVTADARYCFGIPDSYSHVEAAPLLCAGLIGYRTLSHAGDAERLGIYGFGAAAHLIAQVAKYQGRRIFAFTRPGDLPAQQFALDMGAEWAGSSEEAPPEPLDAALLFAPVGSLVPQALRAVCPGGVVVCGGIHMSQIPAFPYELLWKERSIRSVANLTRADGQAFMELAPKVPVKTRTESFKLEQANEALERLREGRLEGAAVLDFA